MPLAATIDLPDRYRVVRHIASGGMASVWEAEDLLLGRLVAVKVLGAQYAADPGARARFQREARTAARVSDQTHVVTIYDIGEHGDDTFIVMEHFAGGTVADRLRTAREAGTRVPRETAVRWLREAATGLDVAHATGIVHRDVKPANLLLDAQDRLAVGDFGIARLADDTHMTMTGQVLGTAAYIAPEQMLGHPASAASDRYALAVVAYELLTGTRPFSGVPAVRGRPAAATRPPPASQAAAGLPAGLDNVLARGLAEDPQLRPRTSMALVEAIEAALGAGAAPDATRPLRAAPGPTGRPRMQPGPPPPSAREPDPLPQPPPRDPMLGSRATGPAPGAAARRRGPLPLLLAALAVAATVALVLVLAGGGDDPGPLTTAKRQATQPAAKPSPEAPTAVVTPPPPPPPAAKPVENAGTTPSELNDSGYALLQQGRYGDAVEPLRAAVQGYKTAGEGGLPYAYAIFNLAVALNRSGNPAEAIPLLQERLQFDDQRKTVQAELDDALAKTGAAPTGGATKPGKHLGTRKQDKRDDG